MCSPMPKPDLRGRYPAFGLGPSRAPATNRTAPRRLRPVRAKWRTTQTSPRMRSAGFATFPVRPAQILGGTPVPRGRGFPLLTLAEPDRLRPLSWRGEAVVARRLVRRLRICDLPDSERAGVVSRDCRPGSRRGLSGPPPRRLDAHLRAGLRLQAPT